jgi:hypothetical protein
VVDDVSREYLPGASGEGWAGFAGLAWTEYNLLRVAPFKLNGAARYYTFGEAPPAGAADTTDDPTTPVADLEVVVGDVVETTEDQVNLRAEPSTAGELEVTGDPVTADGYTWLPVTVVESGDAGFVVIDFVAKTSA